MRREPIASKAHGYLIEGRLTVERVDRTGVIATCRGTAPAPYRVAWSEGRWHCSCAARGDCAHLAALRLVVCPELAA
jgi:hypothetical protein